MGLEEELRALQTKVQDLEWKNSTLSSEKLEYESKNAKLQAQKKDLMARIDHVQKAVMGLMEVLSSHAVIVVRDGLIVPSVVSLQGFVTTKCAITEGDERIENEQNAKNKINQTKLKLEKEVKSLNEKLDELANELTKANVEKQNKDKHIKGLTEQITHQETLISKVNSEKRQLQDSNNRVEEELNSVEHKCRILNEVKTKMERTLKELNENLDEEQKLRTDGERSKKKIESEMKQIKTNVDELQINKKDLEMQLSLARKSTDSPLSVQVKGEHISVPRANNQVKELQQRVLELEEELDRKSNTRIRPVIAVTIDDLDLNNSINPNTELVEKHKKEMTQLRQKLEQMNIKSDVQQKKLKRQIDEANADKEEAVEILNRMKNRLEKEKKMINKEAECDKQDLGDLKTSNTENQRKVKKLQEQVDQMQSKLDKANRDINQLYEVKKNLNIENTRLRTQLEESETAVAELTK